jgi:small subunit ribosomal protein S17
MELQKKGKVEKTGRVISSKMNKSRVVLIESRTKHPFYNKFIKKFKKVMVHDESNISKEGDTVSIIQCRPMSKRKRWIVKEVVGRSVVPR